MELIDVTIKEVFRAIDKLNSRPKKCLNYKAPYEVFEELTGVDMKIMEPRALWLICDCSG
jgi:IS30 family transposase